MHTSNFSPPMAAPAVEWRGILPGDLTARWGARLRELVSGDLAQGRLTAALHHVLQVHGSEVLPSLLGGGVDPDGVLLACITRYACRNDGRFGRSHPSDVVVSADLAAGTWSTSQGDVGTDLVSLVRWYWHGSTTATARNAGELHAESLLLALLGLAALDLSSAGEAK